MLYELGSVEKRRKKNKVGDSLLFKDRYTGEKLIWPEAIKKFREVYLPDKKHMIEFWKCFEVVEEKNNAN